MNCQNEIYIFYKGWRITKKIFTGYSIFQVLGGGGPFFSSLDWAMNYIDNGTNRTKQNIANEMARA